MQAAVGYYVGGVIGMIDKAAAGADDAALRRAGCPHPTRRRPAGGWAHPDVPVHIYDDADHGFHCDAAGVQPTKPRPSLRGSAPRLLRRKPLSIG
ncbi:MAG: hypothetical protein R2710_17830 [Acidimicrobiales bacterium]